MNLHRHRRVLALLVSILVLYAPAAHSGVNLRNGNFYIAYTDFELPGVNELYVVRTYNSKCVNNGLFGYGWGSEFETQLTVLGDMTLLVHENGCGKRTRYYPKNFDLSKAAQNAAEAIVKQMVVLGEVESVQAEEKSLELRNNAELRQGYWMKYAKGGHLSPFNIPENMRFSTTDYGLSYAIKSENGFILYDGMASKTFNERGAILREVKQDGSIITYHRDDADRLEKISTNDGQRLFFQYNPSGYVRRVFDGKKSALYKYKDRNLVESKDMEGNIFRHEYDDNHNMTKISYIDNTTMGITYDDRGFASRIKSRNGNVTIYKYMSHEDIPQKFIPPNYKVQKDYAYGTIIRKGEAYQKEQDYSENSNWYFQKTTPSGVTYAARTVTESNGRFWITDKHPCGMTILKEDSGGNRTRFEANDKCLMTLKDDGNQIIKLKYHQQLDKISYVGRFGQDKTRLEEVWFEYDESGNLVFAKNDEGVQCRLFYNHRSQISSIVNTDKKSMRFEYNEIGKPVLIELEDVGKITVTYDRYGEIDDVESDDGHQVALKVTGEFQQLLSLVKPAGVSF